MVLGVGLYFVPLQLGAARILWPRLALAGYWLFAAGGVIMYSGFLTQQGAATFGWTAYFPLSDSQATPGVGTDFWVIAVILATVAIDPAGDFAAGDDRAAAGAGDDPAADGGSSPGASWSPPSW